MPWWLQPTIAIAKGLIDIIIEAVGADEKKLEELSARVPVVLAEGSEALRMAREHAATEDALTKKARDEALARVRAAGRGIVLTAPAVRPEMDTDEEPTQP